MLRLDSPRPRALLAFVALAGAVLLVIAEFSPLYTVVVGSLQTPRRSVSAGSNHGHALALVAAAAIAMVIVWLRGADVAGPLLGLLGATALVIALAVDRPEAHAGGRLPESLAYSEAQAKPGRGLTLEIAGGSALLACGPLMLIAGRGRRKPVDRTLNPSARSNPPDAPEARARPPMSRRR